MAAATAFGFVYVHPFQDGNGRIHRCLVHHVLAERKFTPPGGLELHAPRCRNW
jgi:Fic family protein